MKRLPIATLQPVTADRSTNKLFGRKKWRKKWRKKGEKKVVWQKKMEAKNWARKSFAQGS
jgi:peptidyl-tRNA hydrolase